MSKPETKQNADIDRRAWHAVQAEELASTLAVNTLVVGEIYYLLSARYFYAPSYTFSALFGCR